MCFFRKKKKQQELAKQNVEETKKLEEVKEKPGVVEVDEDDIEESDLDTNELDTKKASVKKVAKYHVSQNKDDKSEHYKKWRVRKEGSSKTIKFFDTQAEAIKHAEALAESQGTSVVIHKVDGSIRKQNYTKKD